MLLTYKENVHSTQMYIPLKPLFSRHKGIGVQFSDEPTGALDSQNAGMLLGSLQYMNTDLDATIFMVTHDAFSASYTRRVLFMKDGKLFHELRRGQEGRKEFFDRIMHVISLLGGDLNHVV